MASAMILLVANDDDLATNAVGFGVGAIPASPDEYEPVILTALDRLKRKPVH